VEKEGINTSELTQIRALAAVFFLSFFSSCPWLSERFSERAFRLRWDFPFPFPFSPSVQRDVPCCYVSFFLLI